MRAAYFVAVPFLVLALAGGRETRGPSDLPEAAAVTQTHVPQARPTLPFGVGEEMLFALTARLSR